MIRRQLVLFGLLSLCLFLFIVYNFQSNTTQFSTVNRIRWQIKETGNSVHVSSECSEKATLEGPNQKVIAYSLYKGKLSNEKKEYAAGILENYKKIQEVYPEWLMRVYTDIQIESEFFDDVRDFKNLFLCDAYNLPILGDVSSIHKRVWRFLPIDDPTVSIFLSRDLDSFVSDRERSAVAAWEKSDKIFHAMRDHAAQGNKLLAGMWGAKNYMMNETMRAYLKSQFMEKGKEYKMAKVNQDQRIIVEVLYDQLLPSFLIHDSYQCKKFRDSVPFPEQRKNNSQFVGGYAFGGKSYKRKAEVCPVECRPSYGKDWTYC